MGWILIIAGLLCIALVLVVSLSKPSKKRRVVWQPKKSRVSWLDNLHITLERRRERRKARKRIQMRVKTGEDYPSLPDSTVRKIQKKGLRYLDDK